MGGFEKRDITVNDVAARYGLSRRTVIRMIDAAGIQPIPTPGKKEKTRRLTESEVQKIFEPQPRKSR
jgi:transposase